MLLQTSNEILQSPTHLSLEVNFWQFLLLRQLGVMEDSVSLKKYNIVLLL